MQRWWSGLHYPPRPPHPGDERRWLRPPASLARIRPWQPGRPADPEARGLAQTQWFTYIWDLHHSWRIAGRPWSLQVISSVGYSDCRHDGLHPLLPPNIQKLSKMRSLRSGVKGLDTKLVAHIIICRYFHLIAMYYRCYMLDIYQPSRTNDCLHARHVFMLPLTVFMHIIDLFMYIVALVMLTV